MVFGASATATSTEDAPPKIAPLILLSAPSFPTLSVQVACTNNAGIPRLPLDCVMVGSPGFDSGLETIPTPDANTMFAARVDCCWYSVHFPWNRVFNWTLYASANMRDNESKHSHLYIAGLTTTVDSPILFLVDHCGSEGPAWSRASKGLSLISAVASLTLVETSTP